jgi:hypothetical protein
MRVKKVGEESSRERGGDEKGGDGTQWERASAKLLIAPQSRKTSPHKLAPGDARVPRGGWGCM